MNQHVNTGTMKQWTLKAIGRDHLKLAEAAVPVPAENEILIKVLAVALNYRDVQLVEKGWLFPGADYVPDSSPDKNTSSSKSNTKTETKTELFVPGSDATGEVVAVGSAVTRFKPGDRVITTFIPEWTNNLGLGNARTPSYRYLGGPLQGVLSEYATINQDWVVKAPETLTAVEASTMVCAGLTAWTALVDRGHLHAGETVVVQGTGGISVFALQIAVAHGAEVIVVSGDDEKIKRAKALGAKHGINRKKEDWVEAVYRLTNDRGADHVLEMVGGAHFGRSLEAAALNGRVSVIGMLESFEISGQFVPLVLKYLTVEGIKVGNRSAMEGFVQAIDHAGFKPVIDGEYAMADFQAALDHQKRGPFGKVVIRVAD